MQKITMFLAIVCLNVAFMSAPAIAAESAQNNKMKDCAAEYKAKKMEKSEYKDFMSKCLKKDYKIGQSSPPAAEPLKPKNQKERMKYCNDNAKTKAVTGDTRKAFMKDCLSNK